MHLNEDKKLFLANILLLISVPITYRTPPAPHMMIFQIIAISLFVHVYMGRKWKMAAMINIVQIIFWIILLIRTMNYSPFGQS
jgi:Ca2+/Na+ antiporter